MADGRCPHVAHDAAHVDIPNNNTAVLLLVYVAV